MWWKMPNVLLGRWTFGRLMNRRIPQKLDGLTGRELQVSCKPSGGQDMPSFQKSRIPSWNSLKLDYHSSTPMLMQVYLADNRHHLLTHGRSQWARLFDRIIRHLDRQLNHCRHVNWKACLLEGQQSRARNLIMRFSTSLSLAKATPIDQPQKAKIKAPWFCTSIFLN